MAEPIGGIGRQVPTRIITASATAAPEDYLIQADTSGGAVTVTLYKNPGDYASHVIVVEKTTSDATAVTVTDSTFTFTLTSQYDAVRCEMTDAGVWVGTAMFDVGGSGNVAGAASSTNGNLVTFSGSTGKVIADSGIAATAIAVADSKAVSASKGSPLGMTVVSATSVVTPNANATVALFECFGCGGGGGGASGAANSAAGGGGGGAGGYSAKWVTALAGSTFSITIGASGAGGTASGISGGTGGSVVVSGVAISATGGVGGVGMLANVAPTPALGGAAGASTTGGDINLPGSPGGYGLRLSGTSAVGGVGGSTRLGGNGLGSSTDAVGGAATANTGSGGGGASCNTATGRAGGDGATGCVLITYYR